MVALLGQEEANPRHEVYGLNPELGKFIKANFAWEDGNVYFPTVYLIDKEGNTIIRHNNGEPYTWIQLIERYEEGTLQEILDERNAQDEETAEEETQEAEETEEKDETEEVETNEEK